MAKNVGAKIPSIAQMQSTIDRLEEMRNTVLFPRWKMVPAVQQNVRKLKELTEKHTQLMSSKNADDRVLGKKIWVSMSNCYWDILFAILNALTEPHMGILPMTLAFEKTERLFIDFGVLADGTLPFHKDFDADAVLNIQSKGGAFHYLSFTDFIAECWSMIVGSPPPEPMAGPSADARVGILQGQFDEAQKYRDAVLRRIGSEFLSNSSLDISKLIQDLDDCLLPAMKVYTRVPEYREAEESERRQMNQERIIYQEAEKNLLLMLSLVQKQEVNPLPAAKADSLLGLHEKTKVLAKKLLYCRNDAKKIARRANKITETCAEYSPQMKRAELRSMLLKKKEYFTVPAKSARCDESPFCPSNGLPINYQVAAEEIEAISAMDMDMFGVPRIRMYGIPRVVFMPGQGFGTYDWSDNTLLLPAFPIDGGDTIHEEKAICYALATFRWDSDEDRSLKNPYQQIKENRKKSLVDLSASFYRDYYLWASKEKKGYRILSRDTSQVFNQILAPRLESDV
ncbi:MAG: hypothetical protein K6E38_05845 [Fretibacterium sp.]|nr:hypothetical protein [Fretibacterium sp.]